MSDPTSSYATAGIALRVSGALKPHHHDKVETPSGGGLCKILSRIVTKIRNTVWPPFGQNKDNWGENMSLIGAAYTVRSELLSFMVFLKCDRSILQADSKYTVFPCISTCS
jgi:hypothetical protein